VAASHHGDTPYSGKPVTSVPVTPYTTSVDVNGYRLGGYLRCAQVMVNYTAIEEASPAAVSRCACASIAYGVRWRLGY
jgi:hypothetical protein